MESVSNVSIRQSRLSLGGPPWHCPSAKSFPADANTLVSQYSRTDSNTPLFAGSFGRLDSSTRKHISNQGGGIEGLSWKTHDQPDVEMVSSSSHLLPSPFSIAVEIAALWTARLGE